MKGLVVVDVHVEFYSLDDEMKQFVIDKWEELTGSKVDGTDDCVRDAMTAYVMPLATVFENMDTLKWTPTCITSEDGFLISFRRIDRLLYMAMSGDKRDTELILTKKMFVAHRLLTFLYGPVVKRVCPEDLPKREFIWKKLSTIMNCYDRLYWDDLTFLLEAIEWLSFSSQLTPHDLKKACAAALDATCVRGVSHAMLIVNKKIALMRNNQRVTLSAIDQLMIVLMSNYYNGTADPSSPVPTAVPEPTMGERMDRSSTSGVPPQTGHTCQGDTQGAFDRTQSDVSEQKPDQEQDTEQDQDLENEPELETEPESYNNTPCQSPVNTAVQSATTPALTQPVAKETHTVPEEGVEAPFDCLASSSYGDLMRPGIFENFDPVTSQSPSLPSATAQEDSKDVTGSLGGTIKSQGKKFMDYILGPNAEAQQGDTDPQRPEQEEEGPGLQGDEGFLSIMKHHKELVFLRQDVPHGSSVLAVSVPYFLHFITPTEDIILAFTEEVACGALAVAVGSAIGHLEKILHQSTSEPAKTRIDLMDQCLKRVTEYMQKLVLGRMVSKTLSNIHASWTTIKSMNLIRILKFGFTSDTSSERIRNVMENMTKQLITLFDMVFIHSQFPSQLTLEAVMKVALKTNQILSPWSPILIMKGLENIPLATCGEQADDLVYYVFVDRRNNRIIAPSLAMKGNTGNSYLDDLASTRNVQAGEYLREKVWTCLHRIQKVLMNGYTSQMWLDDSFHYSFFLLLYHDSDEENDPLKVVEVNKDMDLPPGELTGSFYRRLRVGDGYLLQFYEILCLHERHTPSSKAIAQSKKLVHSFIRTYLNNPAFRLL